MKSLSALWSSIGKVWRIIIWIIGIIIAVAVLLCIFSGPIAKHYLEKNGKELIGRRISVEKIVINPFLGKVRITNLSVYEKDDRNEFIGFNSLDYRMRLLPLLSRTARINRIYLDSLNLNVLQKGKWFNYQDILEKFKSDSTAKKDTSKPWTIDINNIKISKSHILYKDLGIGSNWGLNNVNIGVPRVYFSDKSTDAGVNLKFEEGGSLSAKIAYSMDKSKYDLQVIIKRFTLPGTLPYFQQSLNVDKVKGYLSLNMHIKGNTDHIMDAAVNGKASVSDFALSNKKEKIFTADSITTDISKFSLATNDALFNYLRIYGPETQYVMYEDSTTNFSRLVKKSSGTKAKSASKPMVMKVNELRLSGGAVTYLDKALPGEFTYKVSELSVKADNFNPSGSNDIMLSAILGKAGKIMARWKGNISNFSNSDLTVFLENIDITDFTPYSKHYVGNKLTGGVLQFVSRNVIKNNYLVGKNSLQIFKPEVSKRIKGSKPVYNLPVRLGLYVLTDRKGLMAMDLPVTGDISNPKFSYRRIIFKAIGNVLVKVAISPFTAMGDLLGLGNKPADHIGFNSASPDFNAKQYGQFQQILNMAESKPDMSVEFCQKMNMTNAKEKSSVFLLKRAYYNSRHKNAQDTLTPQNLFETDKYADIDIYSADVAKFADSLLVQKQFAESPEAASALDAKEKALKLYGAVSEKRAIDFASFRNTNLSKYFLRMNAPAGKCNVISMSTDSMKNYTGDDIYTITANMKDGEN